VALFIKLLSVVVQQQVFGALMGKGVSIRLLLSFLVSCLSLIYKGRQDTAHQIYLWCAVCA
jgi:hypothetical protein